MELLMTQGSSAAKLTASRTPDPARNAPPSPGPVVVDTSQSACARLNPLPVTAVRLADAFWSPRLRINRETTLPSQYRLLVEKGRLDNFRRAAGKKPDIPFQGRYYFNDSDVYKWLEAASWSLAAAPDDAALRQRVEEAIAEIADAQDRDGYLNTYFSVERAGERWTNFDLHEMYCAGHLFQGAVAHFRATRSPRLLDIATRLADHICDRFGPEEQGKRRKLDAHAEVEMALVELYRATGNRRYLEQAQFFLDARGHGLLGRPYTYFDPDYAQDNAPFRELDRVTGHAVRMMYLDCGAADVYAETGEAALKAALDRQWTNMTGRRLYVTGSVGARGEGEAFGKDYQLPSASAYAETCAAIGNVMWNWRMLLITGEARYADVMERALYNGMLSGLSLDGAAYFYENPLADDGAHRRQEWFECACCPPNVARLLASLPGYFASLTENSVWIHLYGESAGTTTLPGGEAVAWTQTTDYPWDGAIAITLTQAPPAPISLHLRIPGWAEEASLAINGARDEAALRPGSYARVERVWRPGDTLRLTLPMPVRRLIGHPNIVDTYGRIALMRGPLVYCVEQADHPDADVATLRLPADADLQAVPRPDLLGGVLTIQGEAQAIDLSGWQRVLYQSAARVRSASHRPVRLTAIPYYAWANRSPGPMTVWIPTF
jgi:DUF1680 family protein